MTFSLLRLPSFRGPAQTPGWIHFPLNYQNRAKSDRKISVEESSVPRPSHKGICPPTSQGLGAVGDWCGYPVPSPAFFPHQAVALSFVLAQSGLGGVARLAWLERPPWSRNTPSSHTEGRPDSPLLRVTLPAVLLKRKYPRNGLKHRASSNPGLHKLHFWGDRKLHTTVTDRVHKRPWGHTDSPRTSLRA